MYTEDILHAQYLRKTVEVYSALLCEVPSEGLHCANHHSNTDKRFFQFSPNPSDKSSNVQQNGAKQWFALSETVVNF